MEDNKIVFERHHVEAIPDYSTEMMADFLQALQKARLELFLLKDKQYGGSWQKDGLLSAYMNLKRKIDRIIALFKGGNYTNSKIQETTLDTLLDLSNYADLNIAFMFFTDENFRKSLIDQYPSLVTQMKHGKNQN